MTRDGSRRWVAPTLLALVLLLPVIGRSLRGEPGPQCATDGVPLEGAPLVRVQTVTGAGHAFCCVGCAERFLAATGVEASRVEVTDETSGKLIEAGRALFVWSRVVAQPATLDRIHVFAAETDAQEHVDAYRGHLLIGDERPFGARR